VSVLNLVLVGGGHSHLFVLEAFAARPDPGVRLTLVSPSPLTTYSGMLPGVIGGQYQMRQAQIDVARLAARAGAAFVMAAVAGIDTAARALALAGGGSLVYDLVSFDIGAPPAPLPDVDAAAPLVALKPFTTATAAIDAALAAARPCRAVIVGGGAAGAELAWALAARLRRRAGSTLTVCDRTAEPLAGRAPATRRRVLRAFAAAAIAWRGGVEVAAIAADAVRLRGGDALPAELIINASGATGPALFASTTLPLDRRGFLRVGDDLRCGVCPELFASGDCAVPVSHPQLPRAGVYAVRQGPLLAHNLRAALRDAPLRPFRPRQRVLALLNTADARAILSYGPLAWHGRAAWWAKDAIDRRFVARFDR